MPIISPSILAANFMHLQDDIESLENIKDLWLHLDVMDGHFVPNLTFGSPLIKQLSKITKLPLDVHLMVENPSLHIKDLSKTNIENVTFHHEIKEDPLLLIPEIKKYFSKVGISIKPKTMVSEIDLEVLSSIDLLLVMSVEPGFGGQSFIPNSLNKIKELISLKEQHNLNFQIQVDGGINADTYKECLQAGADNLVAGSFIFKHNKSKYKDLINSLRQ